MTFPFDSTVDYTNDKTGKITAVNGTAWAQNTTGNYADNIKYRAFGQIKQMDYKMPGSQTSQIKLEYDNRLRVSHSETSDPLNSNYLMKADFGYFADSRVSAKDDLLDNKWDQTFKFDFAGRLSFNQFGISTGTNRVYQQTIQYDNFSQMTSRDGNHWGTAIYFSSSYTNGRLQNPAVSYDAAGNLTAETQSVNEYQQMRFDAVGRRTALIEGWHTPPSPNTTFNEFETATEYVFDGDGRPVIEKKGQRNMGQTPLPSLVTTPRKYQVWSSVLGSSLTTVTPDGNKSETKVLAGGTVIAAQKRIVGENQNYDSIEWRTADPVTGTIGKFYFNDDGGGSGTEQSEALGQKLSLVDPDTLPNPDDSYQSHLFSANEPQWQCEIPNYYGSLEAMPWHCQYAEMKQRAEGDKLYQVVEKKENPLYIDTKINKSNSPTVHGEPQMGFAANKLMNYTLTASSKTGDDDDDDDDEPIRITTSVPRIPPELPNDLNYVNAEVGFKKDFRGETEEALDATEEILKGDNECSKWFGENALLALKAFRGQLLTATITRIGDGDKKGINQNNNKGKLRYFDKDGKEVLPTNPAYRLFPNVIINSEGPFKNPRSSHKVGGTYFPASLESRIAQILHELAHLTYKDYRILIEDDGDDGAKSGDNTKEILDTHKCREAITAFMKNRKQNEKR